MRLIGITVVALFATTLFSTSVSACHTLTPSEQRRENHRQSQYLKTNADKLVKGTWRLDREGDASNEFVTVGYVEVSENKRIQKYRVSIPGIISCGFPNYYLRDGDRGRFYLKSDEGNRDDDGDAFIDGFDFVHFKPEGRAR